MEMRALIVTDGDTVLHVTIVPDEEGERAAETLRAADPGQLLIVRNLIVDELSDVVRAVEQYTADASSDEDPQRDLPLDDQKYV